MERFQLSSLTTLSEWRSSYPKFLWMVTSQWDLMSDHWHKTGRDQEQFTISTQLPIPLAIYDDRYTWAKYGRLILPQVLKLNEVQISSIRGMYRPFFRDFLRVDLEGNISNTLDVSTKSKLIEYLSSVFKGLSETATTEKTFDEYLNTAEKKAHWFERLMEIAVSATTIPLSIFTNLFHQRFSKHDYLESTLEILQQFYIKMHLDHKHYCVTSR